MGIWEQGPGSLWCRTETEPESAAEPVSELIEETSAARRVMKEMENEEDKKGANAHKPEKCEEEAEVSPEKKKKKDKGGKEDKLVEYGKGMHNVLSKEERPVVVPTTPRGTQSGVQNEEEENPRTGPNKNPGDSEVFDTETSSELEEEGGRNTKPRMRKEGQSKQ